MKSVTLYTAAGLKIMTSDLFDQKTPAQITGKTAGMFLVVSFEFVAFTVSSHV